MSLNGNSLPFHSNLLKFCSCSGFVSNDIKQGSQPHDHGSWDTRSRLDRRCQSLGSVLTPDQTHF